MSIIRGFAEKHNKRWDDILNAEILTAQNFEKVRGAFGELPGGSGSITSTDADIVVFGSIARNECTVKSDVDWTLLIDGQANATHLEMAQLIGGVIVSTGLAEPGTSGLFGQNTFSHDLIHYIGGQDDTNHNLSRRLLLLLESSKVFNSNVGTGSAYERVLKGVVGKYINHDSGFNEYSDKDGVPRFLLNDLIRFWRTMCVDFAYKQIEQNGLKWALRNVKLRMSRRLIFVKGLLMCANLYKQQLSKDQIIEKICNFAYEKPLEFLLGSFQKHGINEDVIIKCFDAYNSFLSVLNNEEKREHLQKLDMHQAYSDDIFLEARANTHNFRDALNSVFLSNDNNIGEFTLKYGVF